MIKAIIFDMDGVLIDSEPYYQGNLLKHFEHFGIHVKIEQLYSLAGGTEHHYNEVMNPLLKQAGITREEFDHYTHKQYQIHRTPYLKLLNPHVKDILEWLKENNYRIAIASSSKVNEIKDVLDACSLNDYFEFIMSGEMFHMSKPNPEIYITCVDKFGLLPHECIAIEDSEYGITAAKDASIRCIAKRDDRFGYNQSRADYIIDDLIEIKDILIALKEVL